MASSYHERSLQSSDHSTMNGSSHDKENPIDRRCRDCGQVLIWRRRKWSQGTILIHCVCPLCEFRSITNNNNRDERQILASLRALSANFNRIVENIVPKKTSKIKRLLDELERKERDLVQEESDHSSLGEDTFFERTLDDAIKDVDKYVKEDKKKEQKVATPPPRLGQLQSLKDDLNSVLDDVINEQRDHRPASLAFDALLDVVQQIVTVAKQMKGETQNQDVEKELFSIEASVLAVREGIGNMLLQKQDAKLLIAEARTALFKLTDSEAVTGSARDASNSSINEGSTSMPMRIDGRGSRPDLQHGSVDERMSPVSSLANPDVESHGDMPDQDSSTFSAEHTDASPIMNGRRLQRKSTLTAQLTPSQRAIAQKVLENEGMAPPEPSFVGPEVRSVFRDEPRNQSGFASDCDRLIRACKSGTYPEHEQAEKYVLGGMRLWRDNPVVQAKGCNTLRALSKLDGVVRRIVMQSGISTIVDVAHKHGKNIEAFEPCFMLLCYIASQLEPHSPTETGEIVPHITNIMGEQGTPKILRQGCSTISFLAHSRHEEIKQTLVGHSATEVVLSTMQILPKECETLVTCCMALWRLVLINDCHAIIIKNNGVQTIVDATNQHPSSKQLLLRAFGTLRNIASQSSNALAVEMVNQGVVDATVNVMNFHGTVSKIQCHSLGLLRNLSKRANILDDLLPLGSLGIVMNILELHSNKTEVLEQGFDLLRNLNTDRNVIDQSEMVTMMTVMGTHLANAEKPSPLVMRHGLSLVKSFVVNRPRDAVADTILPRLTMITVVMEKFSEYRGVQSVGCDILAELASVNDFHPTVRNAENIRALIGAMKSHRDADIHSFGCSALASLAVDEISKDFISDNGGAAAVLYSMETMLDNETVIATAMEALCKICTVESGQMTVLSLDGIDLIVDCMTKHSDDISCQRFGCDTLHEFVCSAGTVVLPVEAVQAIVEALNMPRALVNASALRALSVVAADMSTHVDLSDLNALQSVLQSMEQSMQEQSIQEQQSMQEQSMQEEEQPVAVDVQTSAISCLCNLSQSAFFMEPARREGLRTVLMSLEKWHVPEMQRQGCLALSRWSEDHEGAVLIASHSGGIHSLLHAMSKHKEDVVVCRAGCQAFVHMADTLIKSDQIVQIVQAVQVVCAAMFEHEGDEPLQTAGCTLFRTATSRDASRDELLSPNLTTECLQRVDAAMTNHPTSEQLQLEACHLITNLAIDPLDRQCLSEIGVVHLLLGAIQHNSSELVLKEAFGGLLHLLAGVQDNDTLLVLRDAVLKTLRLHNVSISVIRAVLKTLGMICQDSNTNRSLMARSDLPSTLRHIQPRLTSEVRLYNRCRELLEMLEH